MATKREDDGTTSVNQLIGVTAPPAAKPAAQVDVYGKGNRIADGTLKSNNPALTAALDEAAKQWANLSTQKKKVERGWEPVAPPPGAERQLLEAAFKKAGVDPKLIPERADLSAYQGIGQYNGVGADPLRLLQETTRYEDGRTKDEANTRDFIAKGLANGQSSADIWKNVEGYNDSTRGKNSGLINNISNGVSHVGKIVAENPIAQTVISMAAAAYGVPPNVTMALLSANNIGQGQSIESVVKNVAMQYAGGKLGDLAGGAAKGAMAGTGLSTGVTKGLTTAASGAAKGALNSAVNGGDVLSGALKGGVSGLAGAAGGAAYDASGSELVGDLARAGTSAALSGKGLTAGNLVNAGLGAVGRTDTFKDLSADVSDKFKDMGLDSIDVGGVSIPGGLDLKGNIIPGINSKDATLLASKASPSLGKVVNTLQKPSLNGIVALTQPVRQQPRVVQRAPTKQPTAVVQRAPTKQPPAVVLAALNKQRP